MKVLNINLPKGLKEIKIKVVSDCHIGENACDLKLLKDDIDYIKNNDDVYAILNGDIIDNALRASIGDVYSQKLTPQEQVEKAIKLFKPIADKIICINNGNHEERTFKESGMDIMLCFATALGIEDKYCNEGAFIFLTFNPITNAKRAKRVTTTIYATHGRGGGRKEGAKAIRLADMASIIDADVYIHSHTHLPMVFKENYFKPTNQSKSIEECERTFVNTASYLSYAKYAEKNEFKPGSKTTPVIRIYLYLTPHTRTNSGVIKKKIEVTM